MSPDPPGAGGGGPATAPAAYFERVGPAAFRATAHVGGAWDARDQHVAPAMGLLAHVVERDRDARRDDGLVIGRLSYDILGTVPVDLVETEVAVLRPGRTVELVEATLVHAGRAAVRLRAWLLRPSATDRLAGSALPAMAAPAQLPGWDASALWSGGFIASVEIRRREHGPGRSSAWVRTAVPLVAGEPVGPMARAAGLMDLANGLAVRVDPAEVAFPNVDLTAHLLGEPRGEWLGFDTRVSFAAGGLGLTSSVLHDEGGPVGTLAQILTPRRR